MNSAASPSATPILNDFSSRPASQCWEQVAVGDAPQTFVWVWFKPPAAPQGLIVRVPDEFWQSVPQGVSLRSVLQFSGVDSGQVIMWQIYGTAYPGMSGANPLMDQPIPRPVPGADPNIVVQVGVPQWNYMPSTMPSASAPASNSSELFERLDIEWNAALDVEKDLERLRKLLVDMMSRLKTLNRDLSPDERLYSSREDKQDWQDARRFLRESDNRLRACIKEFDIGDPSSAGHRRYFEHIYQQFVVPRLQFEGMAQALSGFEFYRKLLTTLQGKMNSVFLAAQANAERRAQMILARIANKVREASNKKTALGVVMDG